MTNREKILEVLAKEKPEIAKIDGLITNEDISRELVKHGADCKEICDRFGACPFEDPVKCIAVWLELECEE